MKKLVSLLLALIVCMTAVAIAELPFADQQTYPLAEEKVSLTVFAPLPKFLVDVTTNAWTHKWEEHTNVHIDWQLCAQDVLIEKLTLMMATGDMPDVFYDCGINTQLYGVKEGTILAIDQYITPEIMPNLCAVIQAYPGIEGTITATDGHIYALPDYSECYQCQFQNRMYINQAWLDALDLDMPRTTDEFSDVLRAFKTRDPNGNGENDEIPLTGYVSWDATKPDSFLLNAFMFASGNKLQSYVDLDKPGFFCGITEDGYREGLTYLNELFEEGLLDGAAYTQQQVQVKTMANGEYNLVGVCGTNTPSSIVDSASNPARYAEYSPLMPLEGPSGIQNTYYGFYNGPADGAIALNAEIDPAKAVIALRWADFFYSAEGYAAINLGVEGVNWEYAADGTFGINGEQAIFNRLTPYSTEQQNEHWLEYGVNFQPGALRYGIATDLTADRKAPVNLSLYLHETAMQMSAFVAGKSAAPTIRLLDEESEELALITVELESFAEQSKVAFITGEMDVTDDAVWDKYLADLDTLGLERYIEIYNAAYLRQYVK